MAVRIEGKVIVDFERRRYESEDNVRAPKRNEWWMDRDGTPVRASYDYDPWEERIILREVKPGPGVVTRPFMTIAEFLPHKDRIIRLKDGDVYMTVESFSECRDGVSVRLATFDRMTNAVELLNDFVFVCDDLSVEPCGVVESAL